MAKTSVAGLIPARYGSSRLPGKPLAMIGGKSMIHRVYERCAKSEFLDELYVATDDQRIYDAVAAFGGKAIMTRPEHSSGTDRLAEAAESINCDIIVNIQGDQPFIDPVMIEEAVEPLLHDPAVVLSTLMCPIVREEELNDPAVVKVVTNQAGNALYFSRSLIPFPRNDNSRPFYEHVGLYVYRKEMLFKVAALPMTPLEETESLEQLRWLDHGLPIRVIETKCQDRDFSGFSVDTAEDLKRAEALFQEHKAVLEPRTGGAT